MADMAKTIKNGLAIGGQRPPIARNADGVYSGRKTPYFATPQNRIAALYGEYADNCYEAQLQGYDPDDFYRFWPVQIRCEDVSREATGTNLSDDVKGMVVYYPEGVNYVPIGAHVVFASSTWLVTNPANISAILTESIIRRCNAMYNRLDWYGNVVSCPFSLSKVMPRGAQDDYTKTMILADHYFTCYMQLNEVSAAIHENTRMILGDAAYSVRGLDNFTREFTDDGDSTHILYFQIQREENVEVYDDMDRKIADGLAFSWEITLTGKETMIVGETYPITPMSARNGSAVVSTAENPISYLWESSDTSVLEIDENGVVTAVGEGEATITCALAQNESVYQTMKITATEAAEEPTYFIMPSVSALSFDPSAEEGMQISPALLTVYAYEITDGQKAGITSVSFKMTYVNTDGLNYTEEDPNFMFPTRDHTTFENYQDIDPTYPVTLSIEARNSGNELASVQLPVITLGYDSEFFGEEV